MAKAFKGSFAETHPIEYGAQVLKGVLTKLDHFDPALIDDVIVGCAFPEKRMGYNAAKLIVQRAGLPDSVCAQTITRFCSSGLQRIATAANAIMAGQAEVIIAGGTVDTFESAVASLKPGGKIGSVNYLGSGDYVKIPRVEWGVGMGHKQIQGGLMPGGRLRMEKLGSLVASGRLDVSPMATHVFDGWEHIPEALQLMKDKPAELIKPVVRLV